MGVGKPNKADLGPLAEGAGTANAVTGGVSPSQTNTKTATKPNTESYNTAPTVGLSNITPVDIETATKSPTVNALTIANTVGDGFPVPKPTVLIDAPQPTKVQIEYDRELAEVIEASNAGVEGRKPNFSQQPAKPIDPETARLIEVSNAAVEDRKPDLLDDVTIISTDETDDATARKTNIDSTDKHSPWYEQKKRQLQKNKKRGDAYENQIGLLFKLTHLHSQKQITIKTANGFRIRVDLIGVDPKTGKIVIEEVKSSSTARFTKNQIDGFPDLMKKGGVVVGKGKGKFKGGTLIPPQTDIYVRRPNEYKLYENKKQKGE